MSDPSALLAMTLLILQLAAGGHGPGPRTRPLYTTGRATFYHRGLMQRVAADRHIAQGNTSGFATYPDCAMLGRVIDVSVFNPNTQQWSAWARKRIVDCSQTRDRARHELEHLVELSYEDAVQYGYKTEGHTLVRYYLEGR